MTTKRKPPARAKSAKSAWPRRRVTGVIVLADGRVIEGQGVGASGEAVGEVCFNTAMTGYQEILTDPSYAGQIITFTFPHIGNVGVNGEDHETANPASCSGVRGCIMRSTITAPSNYRANDHFDAWLKRRDIVAVSGIDTRALTLEIRRSGMPNAVIAHASDGAFDIDRLRAAAAAWPGLLGMDLAREVTCSQRYEWDQTCWRWNEGYGRLDSPRGHIVAIDYGIKSNILRCLAERGFKVTVVPADTTADDILALSPDGIFLSNGPGDPAATAAYAAPVLRALADSAIPVFGICLGHQLLAKALGAETEKMHQGHHGANHPVRDAATGKVEITSMNHGFTVDRATLPAGVEETHVSLFDGTNCGLAVAGKPVFSVQYHPEASPGPRDSHYLFDRFIDLIETRAGAD